MPKVAFDNSYLTIWRGDDCLRFLDGLCSNKIIGLQENRIIQTAILTNHAKIIDFVTILNLGQFIAIIGFKQNFESMINYITPKILQSDVSITDVSDINDIMIIYGQSDKMKIGTCDTVDGLTFAKISNNIAYCIASKKLKLESKKMGAGFHDWRIENEIPWFGYEIERNLTPYGCGLSQYVHESKGCYTGQEILTRMRTKNRGVKKFLKMMNSNISNEKITTKGEQFSLVIK